MRKIFGFILLFSVFSSCKLNGRSDKYFITGTIKNFQGKSVTLERLNLQKIVAVDSTAIDEHGAFKMEGVAETGFYRLKLDDQTFFLFLLEPAHYKFDIDLSQQPPVKITGPASNEELQAAIAQLQQAQQNLRGWSMTYQMFSQRGTTPDTLVMLQQQMQVASEKFESLVRDSSRTAKNPLVALFYVTNGQMEKYPKETLAVIERMEKEIPNSIYTKEVRALYNNFAAKPVPVAVGQPAPEIDMKDPDGNTIKLSSLKGKVVLIDFWASWCGPCRMEMPNVVAAYKKYSSKGFTVYSVSLDKDATAWRNSIQTLGMEWPNQVSDLKWWQNAAAVRYGVQAIPAAFLLDRNGIIVDLNLRGDALDKRIAEILQ